MRACNMEIIIVVIVVSYHRRKGITLFSISFRFRHVCTSSLPAVNISTNHLQEQQQV